MPCPPLAKYLVSHRLQDSGRADYLFCFDSGNNDNKMHVFSKRELYDLFFLVVSLYFFFLERILKKQVRVGEDVGRCSCMLYIMY